MITITREIKTTRTFETVDEACAWLKQPEPVEYTDEQVGAVIAAFMRWEDWKDYNPRWLNEMRAAFRAAGVRP